MTQSTPNPAPEHADISRKAYELFEARGQAPGGAVEDWLTAEQELSSPNGEAPEYAEVIPIAGESDQPQEDETKPA